VSLADLDAVTLDAHGTLVDLVDPVPALTALVRDRGVDRPPDAVAAAFVAEARYYVERSHEGRDELSLARLRAECAGVFLAALGAELDPAEFAEPFVAALRFEPVEGARETVAALAARGLALAVVSNWDYALPAHLAAAGFGAIPVVVTSAGAGAAKPDPRLFRLALERLGVDPARALHVGDSDADRLGAEAAGLRFRPAPLRQAFATWT
jgi:HAD superfamily hydrolase (TIGR01509 family)